MTGSFKLVRGEFGFVLLLFLSTFALAWLSQIYGHNDRVALVYQAGWALVVSIVSYLFLNVIQYFDSFRPMPSRASILTLLLALMLPFIIVKQTFFLFSGLGIIRYREILLGLPVITLLLWSYRAFIGMLFIKRGETQDLVLFLEEDDKEKVIHELKSRGLENYYTIQTVVSEDSLIVISQHTAKNFESHQDLLWAHLNGVPIRDIRYLLSELRGRESLDYLDLWFFLLSATPQRRIFRFFFRLKTLSEPLCAAILLVIFLPLILLVTIAIKCTSKGPVFFRQRRTGYRGRVFNLVKFRSMVENAEASGPAWARSQSGKITPLGAFLRVSHFDEIPQLWNVLLGHMSFVGPRPERPEYYELLKKDIPLFGLRTMVRPGITGWAQVMAGYAASVEESREKLEFDLYYMKRMSPLMDAIIIIKTLLILLQAKDDLAE